jgi:hypothetical protein
MTVRSYLLALSALAHEVAERPWLLPQFIDILAMAPGTLLRLARGRRRIAA